MPIKFLYNRKLGLLSTALGLCLSIAFSGPSPAAGQVRLPTGETMPTSSGTDFLVARHARLLQPDNQPRQKMFGKSLRAVVTSQEIGQMGNAGWI